MSRLSFLAPILAYLAVVPAVPADPRTPCPPTPKAPGSWELLGTHLMGAGPLADSVNVLFDPTSIGRDGHVSHVYVGQNFVEAHGHWITGAGWSITDYRIDCGAMTYRRVWVETNAGFQNFEDTWSAIESHGEVALVARAVCNSVN